MYRNEVFEDSERRAGLTMHLIASIDSNTPKSEDPAYLVDFWRDETQRWIDEHNRLEAEIDAHGPYRDPALLEDLTRELALIDANVVEASWALVSSLHLVKDLVEA